MEIKNINFSTKTLTVDSTVNLGELYEKLTKMFDDWKEWNLVVEPRVVEIVKPNLVPAAPFEPIDVQPFIYPDTTPWQPSPMLPWTVCWFSGVN